MSLDQAVKKLKLDSRLIEINLATGQLTKEEYETYLKSLPDSADQSAPLMIEGSESDSDTESHTH